MRLWHLFVLVSIVAICLWASRYATVVFMHVPDDGTALVVKWGNVEIIEWGDLDIFELLPGGGGFPKGVARPPPPPGPDSN
ncbi:MAG: hypothetical protein CMJ64_18100 [Planctomycetaceae bacterium]|nr:hypothetical protein [Planctomycetaceae bacterium]